MGHTINQAIEHMNAQSERSDERINAVLQSFQNQADRFTAQMDRMISSPDDSQSPTHTPVRRTRARIWESPLPSSDATDEWDDTMDDADNNNNNSADGSRKSHASRTRHQQEMDATTGETP
jgi:hypothetical protein